MQVDWLKKNLKKFVDLTTRVSLVKNLLTTKEIPASVNAAWNVVRNNATFKAYCDAKKSVYQYR